MTNPKIAKEMLFVSWWEESLKDCGIKRSDASDRIFNNLEKAYKDSHRHYHSQDHIISSLNLLHTNFESLKDFAINKKKIFPQIQMALWFHDFYYNIQDKDNEEKSAERAEEDLGELGFQSGEEVYQLILATKHQGSFKINGNNFATAILLDIDLAILGSAPDEYNTYSQNIRKEYSIYSDKEYREGRKAVLESFLNRKIYHTQKFKELGFEERAKENIKRELLSLDK